MLWLKLDLRRTPEPLSIRSAALADMDPLREPLREACLEARLLLAADERRLRTSVLYSSA